MSQNAAIDRNAGAGGFDWAFHQYDTVGADDDMEINNNLVGLPIQVVVNRDRWQETEADSGSRVQRRHPGHDRRPGDARWRRLHGLRRARPGRPRPDRRARRTIVPPLNTRRFAPIVAALSASGSCPLAGPKVWGDGDILIGGVGSDTIEGRGDDDVIDGDRYVTVAITLNDRSESAQHHRPDGAQGPHRPEASAAQPT